MDRQIHLSLDAACDVDLVSRHERFSDSCLVFIFLELFYDGDEKVRVQMTSALTCNVVTYVYNQSRGVSRFIVRKETSRNRVIISDTDLLNHIKRKKR